MAPHSSTLAWKIQWTENPGRLQFLGSQRVRYDWATSLSLCNLMDCSMPGFPVLHYLPEFAQAHVHWVSDAIQLPHLLLPLVLLPSIFPSIRVFYSESVLCIRWPKYWSFSFSLSPSNEYSGLISFRIDWLDLLAVQRIFKSLLQHYISKASIFGTQPSFWSNSHIHTWLLD